MKKIVPVLAVLGSAVAYAVYKMKKEEQKKLIDFDEELLKEEQGSDAVSNEQEEEEIKEDFISHQEEVSNLFKEINEANNSSMQEVLKEAYETEEEESEENVEESVEENLYPNLNSQLIYDIKVMTKDAIEALAADGDVHANERPVQHMVSFSTKEDLDAFKNEVINKGFVITKGEGELDLVVLHISAIEEDKLISNILYLADQTYKYHGEYRGWQSKISF